MSRRDTILVAVLINSGLLLVLFITAMTNEAAETYPLVMEQETTIKEAVKKEQEIEEIVNHTAKLSQQLLEDKEEKQAPSIEAAKSEEFVFVTVKRGDFLEKIAKANASSVEEIMKNNDLLSTQLQIGQVLKVPLNSKVQEEEKAPLDEELYYTIKQGDNPWLIAMKHRIKLDDLLKLNELDERSAKRLNPGDKIRIR